MKLNGTRMNVTEAVRAIQHRKDITGEVIRAVSNPYNPRVLRIDFIDDSVNPPDTLVWWAEGLTALTEARLKHIADETLHGRYW